MGAFRVGDKVRLKKEHTDYAQDHGLQGVLTIARISPYDMLVHFENRMGSCFKSRIELADPEDRYGKKTAFAAAYSGGINPKDLIGSKKPDYSKVPLTPLYEVGKAMNDGATKYSAFNWREQAVNADVYINAARRHLDQWAAGEENAADSGVHHLAHAAACMFILMDAQLNKCLNDNRVNDEALLTYIKDNAA